MLKDLGTDFIGMNVAKKHLFHYDLLNARKKIHVVAVC